MELVFSVPSPLRAKSAVNTKQSIEYFGIVNYATNERVIEELRERVENGATNISLVVTSAGGPSGTGMAFYDYVRHILKASVTTIGAGDVDSSGVIIFLSGTRRFVTPHTTVLLHPAGRNFTDDQRYTTRELEALLHENREKDRLYAQIVADNSNGKLTREAVETLMNEHSILTPSDLLSYGLIDGILE